MLDNLLKEPVIFVCTGCSGMFAISEGIMCAANLAWPSHYQDILLRVMKTSVSEIIRQ